MKLLISLFLTVVCVHCIPLYDDDRTHVTETRTITMSGYNGTARVGLGGQFGYQNGTLVLNGDGNIGPDFLHYNDSRVRTYDRPAVVTPPPPNSGSTICGENCLLIPPNNQWSMPNRPWVMPSNPSSTVINQREMPYGQWGMPNNPSGQLYTQWGVPNKQLVITNYPSGWSNYPLYATSNVAPNGAPNDMSQQNPSYGSNYPSGWPNYPTYVTSNGALNGAQHDMSQQNPSYAQRSTYMG